MDKVSAVLGNLRRRLFVEKSVDNILYSMLYYTYIK